MKTKIYKFLPILRVHSWGGFGSQLFAAYIVLKVQKRFPNRRIKVVVHTSGVTRRVSELNFQNLGVKVVQVEDYQTSAGKKKMTSNYFYNLSWIYGSIKETTSRALVWMRFYQNANTDNSVNSIMCWTLALRGHYTRITLERELIESLYVELCSQSSKFQIQNQDLVIHYRLGDLLTLGEKKPISVDRVEEVLDNVMTHRDSTVLLSDTVGEDLTTFLKDSRLLRYCNVYNFDPISTLAFCIKSQTFVGTGAKLSLWAAIFRHFIFSKDSFLPVELKWPINHELKVNWY